MHREELLGQAGWTVYGDLIDFTFKHLMIIPEQGL